MTIPSLRSSHRPYAWLLLSAGLNLFAAGHWVVPLAAWLAPIFWLRFFRTTPHPGRSYLLAAVLSGLVQFVAMYGMVPVPPPVAAMFFVVLGFGGSAIYLADRFVARRISGLAATLAFPCALVAFEFLTSLWTRTSWGFSAYSQFGVLPVMQLAALGGMWLIAFLIGWTAALINWAWERGFAWPAIRTGGLALAAVLSMALGYGGLRLGLAPTSAGSVLVATITGPDIAEAAAPEDLQLVQRLLQRQSLTAAELARVRALVAGVDEALFARTAQAAQEGARIIFWPEAALITTDRGEEQAFIARGQALARQTGIYLGMAIALLPEATTQRNENKIVLIGPDGAIAWEYLKARPVPVVEAPYAVPGDGQIPVLDTPYGRLSAVICYDMDDQALMRQAGQLGVDILFAPSGDWREIDPIHTHMAAFRAVEQGFVLVRPANHGLSAAIDPLGRVLGEMDHFTTEDRVLMAAIPVEAGGATPYTQLGDSAAWLGLLGLAGLMAWAMRGART